jgi:hypothetical protein
MLILGHVSDESNVWLLENFCPTLNAKTGLAVRARRLARHAVCYPIRIQHRKKVFSFLLSPVEKLIAPHLPHIGPRRYMGILPREEELVWRNCLTHHVSRPC